MKQLTTLSLCVPIEEMVREVNAKCCTTVDHRGADGFYFKSDRHVCACEAEDRVAVGRVDTFSIYMNL